MAVFPNDAREVFEANMRHITGWGWYWIFWFVGGFGIPETYALIRNQLDTLSWQFWGIEGLNFGHPFDLADWTWVHYLIGILLLITFGWLLGHLVFGIWKLWRLIW